MAARSTAQARRRTRRVTARQQAVGDAILGQTSASDISDEAEAPVGLRDALIASGDAEPRLLSTYDMTKARGSLAQRFFVDQALAAGFTEADSAWWPCDAKALAMSDDVVFRVSDDEQVVRLKDGTLAHVEVGYGGMHVCTAGPAGRATIQAYQASYPATFVQVDDGRVPITFWMMGSMGPIQRLRRIDAQPWDAIEGNYTSDVRAELDRVMGWSSGDDANGQLLLWQGHPGTGKTWALRALASTWAPWAEFHYITDPDVFFGQRSSYMIDVLLSDTYMELGVEGEVYESEGPAAKWKVLILEDTGDLLASNARESYSAGLSRLLNVVDGMIGQGLNVLVLVTTNDRVDDFHPAVIRPGRCASQLSFAPLTAEEATVWMGENGVERQSGENGEVLAEEPATLAELYARKNGRELAMDDQCADCGHDYSDHLGEAGPCTIEDCDCDSYVAPDAEPDGDERPGGGDGEAAVEPVVMHVSRDELATIEGFFGASPVDDPADDLEAVVAAILTDGVPEEHAETIRLRLQGFRLLTGEATRALAADGATDPALPPEHMPRETMPKRRPSPGKPLPPPPAEDEGNGPSNASLIRWQAVLCPEGVPTDDGRIFAPGGVEWRDLPLTLMAMIETAPGHDGAQVAGRIDRIWKEGNLVMGEGIFDAGDYGADIARMVGDGTLRGVSVDIAILTMEVAYRSDVLDAQGEWVGGTQPGSAAESSDDDDSPISDALFDPTAELMLVVWRGKIGAATVCPFPAFESASIEVAPALTAGGSPNPMVWRYTDDARFRLTRVPVPEQVAEANKFALFHEAMSASAVVVDVDGVNVPGIIQQTIGGGIIFATGSGDSGMIDLGGEPLELGLVRAFSADGALTVEVESAPVYPAADCFDDPGLDGPTPLTVSDDGQRVYGHAAVWEIDGRPVCHIGFPDHCEPVPHSRTGYAYFHLKEVLVEEGEAVEVGTLTMDTGHAGRLLTRLDTTRHYDDTGTAVADIVCGEDAHGIWFSGAIRPDVTEEQLRKLRGASVSGDWRNVAGSLELVALLCVNVPGFPIPRGPRSVVTASAGQARTLALTSAGMIDRGRLEAIQREKLRALAASGDGQLDEFAAA